MVPRHRPDVLDVADDALLHVRSRLRLLAVGEDVDLLGRTVNRRPSRSITFETPTKPAMNSLAGCS